MADDARTPAGGSGIIRVLGPLVVQLSSDAEPVEVTGPRRAALLERLVLADGDPVPGPRLAAELWGDAAATDPVKTTVNRLRRDVGPVVVHGPGGYRVDRRLRIDVADFEYDLGLARRLPGPAARRRALESALGHWRGPAFAALGEHRLAEAETSRLEALRLMAEEDLAEARLELGEHRELVGDLQQRVADHPWRERVWMLLMTALARDGRQRDALDAYDRLAASLADELGTDPAPQVRDLRQQILVQDGSVTLPPGPPARGAAVRPPPLPVRGPVEPLVGRQAELDRLAAAWDRVARGVCGGRLVVVAGPAGIGKSALLEAFVDALPVRGVRVLPAVCQEDPPAPFSVLADLLAPALVDLGARVSRPDVADLAALLPGVGGLPAEPPGVGLPADVRRLRLARAVETVLGAVVDAAPTVLVVDDAQWVDEGSRAVLDRALRAGVVADGRLLLVLGVRDDPADPASTARAVERLVGRDDAEVLRLGPLARDEARALADRWLPAGAAGRDDRLDAVADASGGVPFRVRELTRDVVGDGVGSVAAQRLSALDPDAREVVVAAAVDGAVLDLGVLAAATGRTVDAVLDAADAAVGVGLLVADGGRAAFRFWHALARDGVVAGLLPGARARLHERLATAHAAAGHATAVARHLLAAGPLVAADRLAAALAAAAEEALDAGSFEEAATAAQRLLERAAELPALRARALLALGAARVAAGEGAAGRALVDEAVLVARAVADGPLLADALGVRSQFGVGPGERDAQRALALDALRLLPEGDTVRRVRTLLWASWCRLHTPGRAEAEPWIAQARTLAEGLGDRTLLAASLQMQHAYAVASCRPVPQRRPLRERLLALGAGRSRFVGALVGGANVFDDLVEEGDRDAFDDALARFAAEAGQAGRAYDRWSVLCLAALDRLWAGDLDGAERAIAEHERFGADVGIAVSPLAAVGQRLWVAYERDTLDAALPLLAGVRAVLPGDARVDAFAAVAHLRAGRHDAAVAATRAAAAALAVQEPGYQRLGAAMVLAEVAHLVPGEGTAAAVAAALAGRAGTALAQPTGTLLVGPVDTALGLAARADGDLDAAVDLLAAGRAFAARARMPAWEGRAAVHEARARLERGGPDAAERAAEALAAADAVVAAVGAPAVAADVRALRAGLRRR